MMYPLCFFLFMWPKGTDRKMNEKMRKDGLAVVYRVRRLVVNDSVLVL